MLGEVLSALLLREITRPYEHTKIEAAAGGAAGGTRQRDACGGSRARAADRRDYSCRRRAGAERRGDARRASREPMAMRLWMRMAPERRP